MIANLPMVLPSQTPHAPGKTSSPIERVVVLSPFFWNFRDDMWQTTHHIARNLARRVPTLLVEPPVQWNPLSEEFRARRIFSSCLSRRIETVHPQLDVFHRRGFPLGRIEALRKFQGQSNARDLRRLLQGNGSGKTLLWHSFPYWSEPLMQAIDRELFVYHCLDYSPRDEESRLVERADLVFCVSQPLVDKYKTLNPRTFLLPNGVDLDLFDPERAAKAPRPRDLPQRGRLIGFVGYVNCHTDLELIAAIAKAYPQHEIVIVGPIAQNRAGPQGQQRDALNELKALRNVSLLGFRAPGQLPAYIHAFDVCLIPLLPNRFNRERDPMKFYQYMAMGKPVVTTPVPVARRYQDVCSMAETRDGFIAAVGEAISRGDTDDQRRARRAVAERHSWPALVERAWQIIDQELHGRQAREAHECT